MHIKSQKPKQDLQKVETGLQNVRHSVHNVGINKLDAQDHHVPETACVQASGSLSSPVLGNNSPKKSETRKSSAHRSQPLRESRQKCQPCQTDNLGERSNFKRNVYTPFTVFPSQSQSTENHFSNPLNLDYDSLQEQNFSLCLSDTIDGPNPSALLMSDGRRAPLYEGSCKKMRDVYTPKQNQELLHGLNASGAANTYQNSLTRNANTLYTDPQDSFNRTMELNSSPEHYKYLKSSPCMKHTRNFPCFSSCPITLPYEYAPTCFSDPSHMALPQYSFASSPIVAPSSSYDMPARRRNSPVVPNRELALRCSETLQLNRKSVNKSTLKILYEIMGLKNDPVRAQWREKTIMDLSREEGFYVGYQSWIRDTPLQLRKRISESISQRVQSFGYGPEIIEIIIRRGTYSRMQCKLRQQRRYRHQSYADKVVETVKDEENKIEPFLVNQ